MFEIVEGLPCDRNCRRFTVVSLSCELANIEIMMSSVSGMTFHQSHVQLL